MPNAFTNFLKRKAVKNIAGDLPKKTAHAIEAFSDPSETKITINDIKLVSPENFIKKHNCISNIANIIFNKDKIHYGESVPIQPSKQSKSTSNLFFNNNNNNNKANKNIIEHTIEIITNFLSETYNNITAYYLIKGNLEEIYNKTKKLYKDNKQYFDIIKKLPISKLEDVNLLLEKNSFSEASSALNFSQSINFQKNAIEELNKALKICLEQLQERDQLKISENNNISAEIQILINEIYGTKILKILPEQENDLETYEKIKNIKNSEHKCNKLLHFLSDKIASIAVLNKNKNKEETEFKKIYKKNVIFFEKTLPTLYKFYMNNFNKLNKNYKSGSWIFSKFEDSIKFRNIIGTVSKIKFIEKSDANSKKIITQVTGSIDELKIDNYKYDAKLPRLYSRYQDSYNFLFGNKNKYTGKYKKLSSGNMLTTYDVNIHNKWSKFKMNSDNIKKKIEEYFYNKKEFLNKFKECNKLFGELKLNFSDLTKRKNDVLMVKYRLSCFGAKETQKIINISLKGLNKYGQKNHIHIGYFFAYIYYVCSKLSEKNFSLLTKFLGYDSLQTMKNSFDINNFEDSILDFLRN